MTSDGLTLNELYDDIKTSPLKLPYEMWDLGGIENILLSPMKQE